MHYELAPVTVWDRQADRQIDRELKTSENYHCSGPHTHTNMPIDNVVYTLR